MTARATSVRRLAVARVTTCAVLTCAVLTCAAVVGGCSDGGDRPAVGAAPTTTSKDLAADLLPTPPPEAPAKIVGELEAAAASGDFCQVLAAMDAAAPANPGGRSGDGVVAVYRSLAETAVTARTFVPADLRGSWDAVVTATRSLATTLDDNQGDLGDPRVEAVLSASATTDALAAVERYQMTSCPAPEPAAG